MRDIYGSQRGGNMSYFLQIEYSGGREEDEFEVDKSGNKQGTIEIIQVSVKEVRLLPSDRNWETSFVILDDYNF